MSLTEPVTSVLIVVAELTVTVTVWPPGVLTTSWVPSICSRVPEVAVRPGHPVTAVRAAGGAVPPDVSPQVVPPAAASTAAAAAAVSSARRPGPCAVVSAGSCHGGRSVAATSRRAASDVVPQRLISDRQCGQDSR